MPSPVVLFPRLLRLKPAKASLSPRGSTPDDVRALFEAFIVQRPLDLPALAKFFRTTLDQPARRLKRGG
jgi:hypothetical protein